MGLTDLGPALEPHIKHRLWLDGELSWKLWSQQEPIYNGIRAVAASAPVEEIVILCSRQFGKSHLGVILAVEDCLRYPDSCILIIGPTLKQAREIVTPRMNKIRQDAPPGLIRPSKSEGKWYIGSSELVIGGFDQNSSSQRGKTVQNIYIEEVVDSNPDDYVESLRSDLGPALTHSKGGKIIYLTTLPKIPDHPFIIDTMVRAELNGVLYSYTIDDNKQLTPDQYEACVRRAGGRHTVDFRREYLNEIVRDASIVVVPDFSTDRHVKPIHWPAQALVQTTIDWGGVRDFTVAILHWYDYVRNKLVIFDERWFPHNTPTSVITDAVIAMERQLPEGLKHERRIADVPGQLFVDLTTAGFAITAPPKDDWQAAVNNMAVHFSRDEIEIDPRCKLLIQTCNSGTFNKNRTDFERTLALGHCDALACLMYAVRTQDRSSPFPARVDPDQIYRRPGKKPDETILAESLQPRTFGAGPKRFGSFK